MQINKGRVARARRMLLYGENGIGKSSLASLFPRPIFLNLEDGLGDLDVESTNVITSVTELVGCLVHLSNSEYQTIVVDTIDWLEKLIFSEVAENAGKKTIDDIGFGKGYQAVELRWKELFGGFTYLWHQNKHIVFTCHEAIEKFTNPEGDSYNYWRPSLHLKGSGCVTEWCDEVLFLRYRTHTVQKDEGFGAKRAIAIGGRERFIAANKSATCEAKNRLGMPDELPFSFEAIAGYLPPLEKQPARGNIEGIVVDGSSKKRPAAKAEQEAVASVTVQDSPF
jgi:hypothetical protein